MPGKSEKKSEINVDDEEFEEASKVLQDLVRQRQRSFLKVSRVADFVKNFDEETDAIIDLTVRATAVDEAVKEFNKFHEKICKMTPDLNQINEEKFNITFEELMYSTKAGLTTLMEKIRVPASADSPKEQGARRIKLPEITLPTFTGNYEHWFNFKEIFVSLINENVGLSNIQKLHYLLGALKGEALKQIEKVELSSDGYAAAWETLRARYDNKRRVVERHISELFKLKNMKSES